MPTLTSSYMNRTLFFCIIIFSISVSSRAADATITITSPDQKTVFTLYNGKGQLSFEISSFARPVIKRSPIRLAIDGVPVITGEFGDMIPLEVNNSYATWGAHSKAVNRYNGVVVKINADIGKLDLEIRVFNDGVAFRQTIHAGKKLIVPSETTSFRIPSGSIAWYHDMDMHYESVHVKKQIDSVRAGEWMAPPVTLKLPSGNYISITEAKLVAYSGMSLQADGENGLTIRLAEEQPTSYPYRLRYNAEDTLRLRNPAIIQTPVTTPWRVVVIAKDLNQLVNTDLVTNLNDQPDKKVFPGGLNTSWLKPGRAVWKYLDGGGDGTPEVMKHFADGAAALGFEHNIMEGFWSRWTDAQLKDVINYSKQKGVGTWLWKHSKSLRNPASRDSFFKKCQDFGVTGIKIDFFDHEAKEVVDLYESILQETAVYKLHVDFHGANKPTGLSRTYPNELTREAVKGMESRKITDRATHETTIPFTRMVAGAAEYTVLHFGERRANTTWAHQVAGAAIISAPLLTYAAHPDTILANPAVEIIRSIPPTWDETIVLQGSAIGEAAIFARRKGSTWFLAVMNGNQPKNLNVSLGFLKGKYNALIAKDGERPDSIIIDRKIYSSTDTIKLALQPGGGYIARFSK
jgi:alpha-glucosidase